MKTAGRMNIPVIVFSDPVSGRFSLGDGRSRLDALVAVGIKVNIQIASNTKVIITAEGIEIPEPQIIPLADGFDPYTFVAETNAGRRQLSTAEKREIGAKLLIVRPELSDRAIAKSASIDHKTVAAIRKANGEIPHNAKRVEESGRKARGRKPASKTVSPKDTALFDFTARICELQRQIATHKPQRFAGTAASGGDLTKLSRFLGELAALRSADGALPSVPTTTPTGESVAADFNQLAQDEISIFLTNISLKHRGELEESFGHDERDLSGAAELLRQCSALLVHPTPDNIETVRIKLPEAEKRIDPDKKLPCPKGVTETNATLDPTLLGRALGLTH
jgi:hypothetical protein